MRHWRCLIGIHTWTWTSRMHGRWLCRTRTCDRCQATESTWFR